MGSCRVVRVKFCKKICSCVILSAGLGRREEKSIFDEEELLEKYVEEIPVLLLNGRIHNIWRVDPVRLRAALLEV